MSRPGVKRNSVAHRRKLDSLVDGTDCCSELWIEGYGTTVRNLCVDRTLLQMLQTDSDVDYFSNFCITGTISQAQIYWWNLDVVASVRRYCLLNMCNPLVYEPVPSLQDQA